MRVIFEGLNMSVPSCASTRVTARSNVWRFIKNHTRLYSAPGDREIPNEKRKHVPSAGTYPKGFLAASTHVGVKASNTKYNDLALIVSKEPCAAAAMFTKNRFKAAPVVLGMEILGPSGSANGIRAVIANSGCANAVTGKGGLEDARTMSLETDKCLPGTGEEQTARYSTLPLSTGVIGQRLPISKIVSGIPTAASSLGGSHGDWLSAANAICTTDTFPKLISSQFSLPSFPDQTFSIAGMVKGAGMIHPNMGTLLSIVCTDAPVTPSTLRSSLGRAVQKSFNSISIDGDTSTNDTIVLLANGAGVSGAQKENGLVLSDESGSSTLADCKEFENALTDVCMSLSHLVIRDGEGATKFVTIRMRGYKDPQAAREIASTVARSPLVKTALYGKDANWGRVLCAIGYTNPAFMEGVSLEKLSVSFLSEHGAGKKDSIALLVKGEPQNVDEIRAASILASEDLEILIDLGMDTKASHGTGDLLYWTCDLSHEYVTINGDYRT